MHYRNQTINIVDNKNTIKACKGHAANDVSFLQDGGVKYDTTVQASITNKLVLSPILQACYQSVKYKIAHSRSY